MEQISVAVIWIDWYAYHLARFRALLEHCSGRIRVTGIELVGGAGVHRGLQFRGAERDTLPVVTLLPDQGWHQAGQWRLARATWNKLNELNPSTVLVPGYYNAPALAAAIWGRVRGRRTVLMTESTEQDHARNWWKESLKSVLIRSLFKWAIAGGKPHAHYLEKLGFPMDRVGRYYDVVDNDFFAQAAGALRSSSQPGNFSLPEDYFLYVGRLAAEKNVSGLLEAFARYRAAGGVWSLVLAGDGPLRAELEGLAGQLGVADQVRWMGLQPTEQLPLYYAFASCFVLPSDREPWGLVVNEALASGLPVVVSARCGCAADLVSDGENGFLFDPSIPGDLAGRLIAMDRLGAGRRLAMADRSREIVARFSPGNWAAEVERIASSEAAR